MIASGHRLAPFIGAEWPGIPGSLYAGVAVAEPADGYPDDAHLVVLPGSMTQCRNYHGCIEWAAQQGVDAHAPTHREGALIAATLRGRLDMSVSWWFWTGAPFGEACAWYGNLLRSSLDFEYRSTKGGAVAVRRFAIPSSQEAA